jgi:hypothetical protein
VVWTIGNWQLAMGNKHHGGRPGCIHIENLMSVCLPVYLSVCDKRGGATSLHISSPHLDILLSAKFPNNDHPLHSSNPKTGDATSGRFEEKTQWKILFTPKYREPAGQYFHRRHRDRPGRSLYFIRFEVYISYTRSQLLTLVFIPRFFACASLLLVVFVVASHSTSLQHTKSLASTPPFQSIEF